ncbi:hypothetical protein ILUMI_12474 [Ignelater luminosus]|uniref:Lipocalin/cytosolic fatty-acid binding domain-containing protein n=1 Tax=Ignelater luminosus TaxID=2038154 RepID=A0A8K0GCA1_IGNLU|nr:hypothetical protein ILUMI_12474 [Ignelater luminosus]
MHKLTVLFVAAIFGLSYGDTGLGSCPSIQPVPQLEVNRLLGYWYVIQKTEAGSPCVSYNITQNEQHLGKYKATSIEQHPTLWSSALYHEHRTTGDLSVIDPKNPGHLALDLPLDIGTTSITVFMTDYDNYAAIFTCKKLSLVHRWSIEILSRTPTLNMDYVDKVRTRISSYNIDPFSLQILDLSKCAAPGQQGSVIKTVSDIGHKATNVVSNVGQKINNLATDPKA